MRSILRPVLLLTTFATAFAPALADTGVVETAAWRADRDARLRGAEGWLSLIGLHWLEPGTSRIGSAPANDIVLATGPDLLGEITVDDDGARLCELAEEVAIEGPQTTAFASSPMRRASTPGSVSAARSCI